MGGDSRTLDHQYDLNGNRTNVKYPGGNFFYDYDQLNRMVEMRRNSVRQATYVYDDQGVRTRLTPYFINRPTDYGYDKLSRLTSLSIDQGPVANDVAFTFAYNPASQAVTRTRSNNAYEYDEHDDGVTVWRRPCFETQNSFMLRGRQAVSK